MHSCPISVDPRAQLGASGQNLGWLEGGVDGLSVRMLAAVQPTRFEPISDPGFRGLLHFSGCHPTSDFSRNLLTLASAVADFHCCAPEHATPNLACSPPGLGIALLPFLFQTRGFAFQSSVSRILDWTSLTSLKHLRALGLRCRRITRCASGGPDSCRTSHAGFRVGRAKSPRGSRLLGDLMLCEILHRPSPCPTGTTGGRSPNTSTETGLRNTQRTLFSTRNRPSHTQRLRCHDLVFPPLIPNSASQFQFAI